MRYLSQGYAYWGWLSLFAASLLFREFHFHNTSVGADLLALGLLIHAWRRYPRYADFFAGRSTLTLLALALLSYACAVAFDKGIFDTLTSEHFRPFLVEEYIEVLGHISIFLMTLFSRTDYNPLLDHTPLDTE